MEEPHEVEVAQDEKEQVMQVAENIDELVTGLVVTGLILPEYADDVRQHLRRQLVRSTCRFVDDMLDESTTAVAAARIPSGTA